MQARESFSNTVSGTDLIVGARSGQVNLLLYSVFRIGNPKARRTWLVEGYATGLSLHAALTLLRLPDAVLVCFSAGNLKYVAGVTQGQRLVFADNDASGTGERVARETGLPYCMAPVVGWDANDMHVKQGVFALADLVRSTVAGLQMRC